MKKSLQEWVDKYPGDQTALVDALVAECERLRGEVETWKDRWRAERQAAVASEKAFDRVMNEGER